ncbi:high nitrogen upregulated cytochrome P450 monooxygenase 2 [Artomyces pyxidatus]|uniref:High nitrogen upregulated cytochrome P450 monooxygenase 2 n=1 Tax=Artomyces pyxidatus TaxID=48021 RepID=A0ACB8TCJ9_9AGAM|nr:high nitrogen upregulated cytochrome P450 monooxygenase 2 [Artomyces pyxidatus]
MSTSTERIWAATAALSLLDIGILVVGSSLSSYIYFKRFEPQRPLPLFILVVLIPGVLSVPLSTFLSSNTLGVAFAFTAYGGLVLFYTLIYRLSPFHPLAQYPGPILARISKWWSSFVCARGKQHLYYRSLHEQYGDIVRVGEYDFDHSAPWYFHLGIKLAGPNELSIRDASVIPPILGPGGLPKGPWWDNRTNPPALVGLRDPVEHQRRRKPWNRAFTSSAVKEYETIVASRSRQLVDRLASLVRSEGKGEKKISMPLDIGAWMSYFTTDFMGDMAFGGGFELMEDGGDAKGVWHIFESGMKSSAVMAHTSWSLVLLKYLPGTVQTIQRMRNFGGVNVVNRMKLGAKRKDLFYYLSGEDDSSTVRPSLPTLTSDGILAIIAGSDTTATTLTALFNYLMQYPAVYERLQQEIEAAFPHGEEPIDAAKLSRMSWLNACINESLRLYPAVPSGSQRSILRGEGPRAIGHYVFPEQTQVFVHTYSVHRDPRNFSSPDQFIPQRWLRDSADDMDEKTNFSATENFIHNSAAFIPFSYGPTICAGKNLALLEMRMVVCFLMQRLEFRRISGAGIGQWEDELEDQFVIRKPPLWANVSVRS